MYSRGPCAGGEAKRVYVTIALEQGEKERGQPRSARLGAFFKVGERERTRLKRPRRGARGPPPPSPAPRSRRALN